MGEIEDAVQEGLTAQGYTTARATKVDSLDAAVTSRLGAIVGIDRGTILVNTSSGSLTNTATVGAVNTSRAVLSHLGHTIGSNSDVIPKSRITLTNSTTITANAETSTGAYDVTVSYELVEYGG